jgi:hypothetical protein
MRQDTEAVCAFYLRLGLISEPLPDSFPTEIEFSIFALFSDFEM